MRQSLFLGRPLALACRRPPPRRGPYVTERHSLTRTLVVWDQGPPSSEAPGPVAATLRGQLQRTDFRETQASPSSPPITSGQPHLTMPEQVPGCVSKGPLPCLCSWGTWWCVKASPQRFPKGQWQPDPHASDPARSPRRPPNSQPFNS